jgi:exonuclease VII large subunit
MDPAASLKRGFALIYTTDGRLVKKISQVQPAAELNIEVSDGRIVGTVTKTQRR